MNSHPSHQMDDVSGASASPLLKPRPPRPIALHLRPEGIPIDLSRFQRWVAWQYQWDGSTWKKRPLDPCSGRAATVTNRATWGWFDDAQEWAEHTGCDGIGFVLTHDDRFVAVDLDHCIDSNQELAPWASEIVATLNSYTERSPSGHGLRIFVRGTLPKPGSRKGLIELYASGRYVTLTGHHLAGTPSTIESRDTELGELYQRLFGDAARATGGRTSTSHESTGATVSGSSPLPSTVMRSSDERVLQQAMDRYGAPFHCLQAGDMADYDHDHSRADLGFLSKLARFTRDPEQLDRLLRSSGLYREEKWEREDYRERTIAAALDWSGVAEATPLSRSMGVGDDDSAAQPRADRIPPRRPTGSPGRWHPSLPGDAGFHQRRCPQCGTEFTTKRGMGGYRYCASCRNDRTRSTTAAGSTKPSAAPESTNAVRQCVLRRDKQRCRCCGMRAYQVAYVQPVGQGGAYVEENLFAVCDACRNVAPHLTFDSVEAKVAHVRQSRKAR